MSIAEPASVWSPCSVLLGAAPTAGLESATVVVMIVGVAGIIVSGVVGPWVTVVAHRRSARRQFDLDQAATGRDRLRDVLDDAAVLLARGATHLRHVRDEGNSHEVEEARDWAKEVSELSLRLRLRIPENDQIVLTYDRVIDRFEEFARESNTAYDAGLARFESARNEFLAAARYHLAQRIELWGKP